MLCRTVLSTAKNCIKRKIENIPLDLHIVSVSYLERIYHLSYKEASVSLFVDARVGMFNEDRCCISYSKGTADMEMMKEGFQILEVVRKYLVNCYSGLLEE